MKAWLLDNLTGIQHLRLAEVPDPAPRPGHAILKVLYAALNPADRYLAQGEYPAKPPLPHILGRDGLGIVEHVSPDVRDIKIGDKRLILRGPAGVSEAGTFAEKVSVNADYLLPVPAGWSNQEACCATLVYLTSYQALTMWPDFTAPGTVLITGASGGVGASSLQLAKAMGHHVIALSRDPAKQNRLRELGADICLDPSQSIWRKNLRDALGDKRVDLAIDNIGGPLLPEVIETMNHNGRISCVGRLAGPVPQFNTASLFFRRLRLGGVAVSTYSNQEARHAWTDVLRLLNSRHARPLVDQVYPFKNLPEAFARLAAGPMGKVVVAVSPPTN